MLPRSKNPTPRVVIVREDDEKRPTSVKASDRGDDDPAQNDQAPASQSGDEGEGSSASGSSGHDGDNNNNNHDDDSKGEGKGSLLLSRNSVPSVYPQVLALPITRRPLFPGFYKAVVIRNPHVCAAIKDAMKRGQPYVGAFLLKDEEEDSDVIVSMDRVHRVGVFAQITSIFPAHSGSKMDDSEEGITAVLYPHRRIVIDELITPMPKDQPVPSQPPEAPKAVAEQENQEDESDDTSSIPSHNPPFQTAFLHQYEVSLVNVTNLQMEPYDRKPSQYTRAVMSELISVFKDIANLNPLFRDQIANFSISQGAGNVFEEPEKLADFAAAVSKIGRAHV